tara:strand:+ start:4066 stop:5850 length:1785 start_codon:yes stop_codon:yes gene_type:complete
MAELAIPIVALGSLFILANQDKKKKYNPVNNTKCQENFFNIDEMSTSNTDSENTATDQYLPINTNNSTVYTDKFFDSTNYKNISEQQTYGAGVGNNTNDTIKSLTGNTINKSDFQHNNMVPFFGSKIRGATADSNLSEAILDNKQGTGNLHFVKEETAPLFKPQESMSWQNGAPNNTDFFQSRMNTANKMNNVNLWDQEKVAPGLNLGYTTDGVGGFNSGLIGRDNYMPKNVDELRISNKPKMTNIYNNPQGPGASQIKNLGVPGKIEKHLPDKFYESGKEHWFTTTGIEQKPTVRSQNLIKDEKLESMGIEYYGSGRSGKQVSYTENNYEESKRQQLGAFNIKTPNLQGQNTANKNDYSIDSYSNLPNNRSTTQDQLNLGGVSGALKSILAPINNILRPSRKENVVGNLRECGNINNTENQGNYVVNKNDKPKTTIRNMTCDRINMNHLNVQGKNNNGYETNSQTPIQNQRDTTSVNYTGGGNSYTHGMRDEYSQQFGTDNVNKSYESRINQGGTQMFNQNMNVENYKIDSDRNNNRMWVPSNCSGSIPSQEFMGNQQKVPVTYPEQCNNRLDSSLLNAFKSNPYTQSLQSYA